MLSSRFRIITYYLYGYNIIINPIKLICNIPVKKFYVKGISPKKKKMSLLQNRVLKQAPEKPVKTRFF
ncbi:MAG: hypothetical protein LBD71_06680, partial [Treponema sp.]|nr:hypothetical protein [Treponema sp.]